MSVSGWVLLYVLCGLVTVILFVWRAEVWGVPREAVDRSLLVTFLFWWWFWGMMGVWLVIELVRGRRA